MSPQVEIKRAANGNVTVTVTLREDGLAVKWSVKAFSTSNSIRDAVKEARREAERALGDLRAAVSETERMAA